MFMSNSKYETKFYAKNRKIARFCCSTCPRWIAKKCRYVNLGIPILFERQHHKSQINESNLHISRTPKKERRKIKWNHLLGFLQNCLEIHFWQTCVQPILRSFITTHKFQLHSAWKGSEISLSLLLYPLGKVVEPEGQFSQTTIWILGKATASKVHTYLRTFKGLKSI